MDPLEHFSQLTQKHTYNLYMCANMCIRTWKALCLKLSGLFYHSLYATHYSNKS